MPYTINFNNTPSSLLMPPGFYNVQLFQIEERWSQLSAIRMYFGSFKVEAPASYANRFHDENFIFGKRPWSRQPDPSRRQDEEYEAYANLDDPEGLDPLSWRFSNGIRQFADMCRLLKMPLEGEIDMDQLIIRLNSSQPRVGIELRQQVGSDDRTRAQINQFFALGEQEPRLLSAAASSAASAARRDATNGQSQPLSSDEVTERRRGRATVEQD